MPQRGRPLRLSFPHDDAPEATDRHGRTGSIRIVVEARRSRARVVVNGGTSFTQWDAPGTRAARVGAMLDLFGAVTKGNPFGTKLDARSALDLSGQMAYAAPQEVT